MPSLFADTHNVVAILEKSDASEGFAQIINFLSGSYNHYAFTEIADDVAQPTLPLPPSPVIPSSPPHQSPRTSPSQATEVSSILVQQVLDKCSALVLRVEGLESANT
nr:hypothetical protein [Tanacetum cinerariifolium]